MDNLTKKQRSFNMSRIRSSNTQLEQKFFKLLNDCNITCIKHPKLFGKPDCRIGRKTLIFLDSDFWHGWNFSRWKDRLPEVYWRAKIANNVKRDRNKFSKLRRNGYTVMRIWEHEFKNYSELKRKIIKIFGNKNISII